MLHFKKLLFSLTYLSGLSLVLSSCSYEITIADLSSLWETTWGFEQEADYQFDANYVEVVDGKARLKPLDLNFNDFSGGTHVGSHGSEGNLKLLITPTAESTHVNLILPDRSSNLVGYWRFDEDFLDSSGNGLNGIAINSPTTTSVSKVGNGAGNFVSTSNQYLRVDSLNGSLSTGDSTTISFWAKTTNSTGLIHQNVVFSAHSSTYDNLFRVGVGPSGELYYSVVGSGDTARGANFNDGRWHHFVIVIDYGANTATQYVDGLLYTPIPFGQIAWTDADFFSIAQEWDSGETASDFFNGSIDEFAFWNSALSESEVLLLYNAQNTNFTELSSFWTPKWDNIVGYWKMDGNWEDSSVAGNHGVRLGLGDSSPEFESSAPKIGTASGQFDGTDDAVLMSNIGQSGETEYSLSGWLKIDFSSVVGTDYAFGIQDSTQGARYTLSLVAISSGLVYYVAGSSGQWISSSPVSVSPESEWFHYVMTWSSSDGIVVYINGNEINLSLVSTGSGGLRSGGNFSVGIDEADLSRDFLGLIDDVAIWNTLLSQVEIKTIYNRQKQKYAGSYDSEVIDLGSTNSTWPDLSWLTSLPFGKELVGDYNNDGSPDSESSSDYSYQSGDLSDGLIGYWRFENNTTESSQNLSDISVNAPTYVPGQLGMAAQFNGVNTGVIVSEDLGDQSELTIALWYKDDGTDSGWRFVADARASETWWLGFPVSSDQLEFAGVRLGANLPAIGVWQHFLIRATSSSVELYIDGAFVESGSPVNLDIGASLRLGNRYTDNEALSGGIDEFGLWSRALSSSEIQQLYRRGANRIKLQVKSCVDSTCECKSYGPGGTNNDCDGDTIVNTLDHDDTHKAEFIGPGGDGTTYYSELYNRPETEVGFQCALNTTDSNPGICVSDEISLTGSSKPTGPEFLNLDYTQFVKPPANRYAQYRVYMEADENTACGGEPCLPELSSVSFNPQGTTKYFGETQVVKPIKALYYKSISNVEIDADDCVKYQLSPNDSDYYWWNGTAWVVATDNNLHVSTKEDVKAYMTKYATDRGPGNLHIKAFLSTNSDQTQGCEIRDFDVFYSTKL